MKGNFHTHTYRCLHAAGTERDYVNEAVSKGLAELGFSDHAPFPDKDYGLRMQYSELPEYINEIDKLKNEFNGIIKLYKGLEIEYHPVYLDYYKQLIRGSGLDYLALGEHTYTIKSNEMKNIFFAQKTDDYVKYAYNVAEAMETGLFAFVAHPDLMFLNEFAWDKNCDKACDIILRSAEKYDVTLEYNANGLRRGLKQYPDGVRYPYPDERFWKQLSGSRQKVIIGSDCHVPEQVYDEKVQLAEKLCNDLNLNVIETLF